MGDGQHPYQYQYQPQSEGSVRRVSGDSRQSGSLQQSAHTYTPPIAYDRASPASGREDDRGKSRDEDAVSLIAGLDPRLLSGRVKLASKNSINSACISCHKRKRKVMKFRPSELTGSVIDSSRSAPTVQRAIKSANTTYVLHQSKLCLHPPILTAARLSSQT
jgi:hypothetical protein